MVKSGASVARALIVVGERDEQVRALESYLLADAGFTVDFAADGREALRLARERRPSLIVTDVLVPGVDGLALCRRVKQDPELKHASVLVLSYMSAEVRAREAGADAFLRRPCSRESLLEAAHGLLSTRAVTE